jgi:hypothetical protein
MVKKKFGPGFLPINSLTYRIEYIFLALFILGVLIWRALIVKDLNIFQTIFFAIMPDLVFIPIIIKMKRRNWPSWGSSLYNIFHNWGLFVVLLILFWFVLGEFPWPILGLALHITLDRIFGYNLRSKK